MKIIESFKALPLRPKQLLSLGIVFALVIALPLFIWGILTQRFDIRKKATESLPLNVYENEFIRVWDSRVFPGIIDLFYKQPSDWRQYNNVVPIAKVGGVWANAELDRATIETTLVSNVNNTKTVKYQFAKLSNGAHFYLMMELAPGQKSVKFTVYPNEDSAPIEAMALGNYYGLAQLVKYISINNQRFEAGSYPRPAGGNYELGDFYTLPSPTDKTVKFWGEGYIQKQFVDVPLTENDVLQTEVRYYSWLPEQPIPGYNWFETIAVTREPFTTEKAVWHFGWEEQPVMPSPIPTPSASPVTVPIPSASTPTPTPTQTPIPSPSPTPLPWQQTLKFKMKFEGVEDDSANGAKVTIRFVRPASGFDYQTTPVGVTYTENGIYETIVSFISLPGRPPSIPVVDGYAIFIKGEKHLARKFCYQTAQTIRCSGNGYIYIGATNVPSIQTFDFTGVGLEPGDLPIQDGVADTNDFGKIRALLSKACSQLSIEEKATADLDYSGCVNIRDAFLMRKTLEAKYDEY